RPTPTIAALTRGPRRPDRPVPAGTSEARQQAGALAVRPDRHLPRDRGPETPVEGAARVRVHDRGANPGIDGLGTHAANVERRRPIEEDRLDAVLEGDRRRHVQD